MNHIHIQHHKTPHGEFILGSFQNKLCLLDSYYRKNRERIDRRLKTSLNAEFIENNNRLLIETRQQIDDYFIGLRQSFSLPLLMVGTDFQKTVWQALCQISYGETISYQQLAQRIGHEKAVRAVANANAANALGLVIPCHRVINSNGDLGGYAGGLALKKHLLQLEQQKL
ncbi:MAG: methylated-DNA--[protein]-cysteine S-methyltransferase [bacterium]